MTATLHALPVIPAPATPPPAPLFPEQDPLAFWAQAFTILGYDAETIGSVLIPGPYTSLISAAMADMGAAAILDAAP